MWKRRPYHMMKRLRLAQNVCTGEWKGPDANTSHLECAGNWQSCVVRGQCSDKLCVAWSSGCVQFAAPICWRTWCDL